MADRAHADTLEDMKIIVDAEKDNRDERVEVLEEEGEEGRRMVRECMEENFTFMVGMYAVRPFLRKLGDFAGEFEERRFAEARRKWDERLDELRCQGTSFDLGEKMKKVDARMKKLGKSLRTKVNALCSRMKGKRELCFGEIESGDDLPRQNGHGTRLGRRNDLKDGLLWYYGDVGVMAFRAMDERPRIVEDEKIEEIQAQVCVWPEQLLRRKADN